MHKLKNSILVVDNEPHAHKMLGAILRENGFNTYESFSGKQSLRMFRSAKPDMVMLDLALPDMDGKEVITSIRECSQIPIIIVTARSCDEDIATALNLGANDYICKPFNVGVLLARTNAALRGFAVRETGKPYLINGPLRMNLVRHEVFMNDRQVSLTPKEYNLLRYLMVHCGKMLTHRDILRAIWGTGHINDTAYLRVYIQQIREKIEETPKMPSIIMTKPGVGYYMEHAGTTMARHREAAPLLFPVHAGA